MDPLLQVRDLKVEYRSGGGAEHCAVAGVSFDVGPGEVAGVMGESGCGKTSLALALLGLQDRERAAVSGAAMLHGTDLLTLGERQLRKFRGEKISLVSQEPGLALCPVRRVGEQISEVLHAHSSQNWKQCRAEAEFWIDRVGLAPTKRIWDAYPHQLSGGQVQRVVLAQALICKPSLLVADEPTASLDARNQAEFVELLRSLKALLGLSVLLISHAPEIQASLADRVLVMRGGRIVEQGTLEQVFRHPANAYTRAMLSRASLSKTGPSGSIFTEEYASQ